MNLSLKNLTTDEGDVILAGCAALRIELDKAFKACMKAKVQPGAEKVSEKVKTVLSVENKIKEAMAAL